MSDQRRRGGDGRRRDDRGGGGSQHGAGKGRSGSKEDRRGGGSGKGYSRRDRRDRRDDGKEANSSSGASIKNRPVILKPPDRKAPSNDSEEFPTLAQAHASPTGAVKSPSENTNEETKRSSSPATPAKVLLGRKESPLTRVSDSPAPDQKAEADAGPTEMPFRDKCARLIDEQHQFCASGLGPVMTDNTEFLVVGVVGLQSAGKSTVLNHLANYWNKKKGGAGVEERVEVFREQTFEKMMMGEHGTTGVKAWVSPTTRTILLDSQPINSMSVLDRTMQVIDKKHDAEFSTLEATVEIHSLQMLGFLMSVCHVLILVQDHFVDPNLMETLQTAEMLRPSSLALIGPEGGAGQMVEYFPELVLVHNKAGLDDFCPERVRDYEEFYRRVFVYGSQLKANTGKVRSDEYVQDWRSNFAKTNWKMGEINLFLLPSFEGDGGEDSDSDSSSGYGGRPSFEDHVASLRRKVVSVRPVHLTTAKLSEKLWLKFAEKTWDNIKNCSFYSEYSRLLN